MIYRKFGNTGIDISVLGFGAPSEKIRSMIPGGARSNPELALRFVLTNPAVCCALSGMSSMQQVEENCATASGGEALRGSADVGINNV